MLKKKNVLLQNWRRVYHVTLKKPKWVYHVRRCILKHESISHS